MSDQVSLAERVSRALTASDRGVLGLVDELLAAALEHDLRLEWQAGKCRVHFSDGQVEAPLPKSVFRAVLARIAALCNEQTPDSASPFGGQGEVMNVEEPGHAVHAAFVNTPDEQWLELTAVRPSQLSKSIAEVLVGDVS